MANGDIRPSRFVQVDSSADHKGIEATANVPVIGVSMESSNYPPLSDLSITVLAASAGQYFKLYGSGEQCLVEAGAAITRNNKLKSMADGRAEPIATTGTTLQHWGAIALESAAAAGELIPVQVLAPSSERPAIA
jgi:hypothetical protein